MTPYITKIRILALLLIIIGLFIALIPWTLLPVCESVHPSSPHAMKMDASTPLMKCGYSARAEVIVGILIILSGLFLTARPREGITKKVGVGSIVLGIFTILIPTVLIGVCNSPSASCVIGTKPGWILLGISTIILGIIVFLIRDPRSSVGFE